MTCPVCGYDKQPNGKRRSTEQHRRFFGLIRAAYLNWPEAHEFTPDNEEHLRNYLICAAGYRTGTDVLVPFAEDQPSVTRLAAMAIEQAITAAGTYAFVRTDDSGGRVKVYRAKSIKFGKMSHLEFCALSTAVNEIIATVFGMDADEFLSQHERAA